MHPTLVAVIAAVVGVLIILGIQWRAKFTPLLFPQIVIDRARNDNRIEEPRGRWRTTDKPFELHSHDFPPANRPNRAALTMQIIVTILVLVAALYVVVIKRDAETSLKDWSYGVIGTVLGFWLKPSG